MNEVELKQRLDILKSDVESHDNFKIDLALSELEDVPMCIELLFKTGIGKAVNSLRKDDTFGERVKKLVDKWKSAALNDATKLGTVIYNVKPKTQQLVPDPSGDFTLKTETISKKNVAVSHSVPCAAMAISVDDSRQCSAPANKVQEDLSKQGEEFKIKHKSKHHDSKRLLEECSESKPKKRKLHSDADDGFTANSGFSFEEAMGCVDRTGAGLKQKPSHLSRGSDANRLQSAGSTKHKSVNGAPDPKVNSRIGMSSSQCDDRRQPKEHEVNWSKMLSSDLLKVDYKPLPPMIEETEKKNNILLPATSSATSSDDDCDIDQFKSKKVMSRVHPGRKAVRTYSTMPSLLEICLQTLCDNIDAIDYTGGVPYDILKPVLTRATVDQLKRLENYNEYLLNDTDELWAGHCGREFKNVQPEADESWRNLYMRKVAERNNRLKSLAKTIATARAHEQSSVRVSKQLETVKAPRDVRRKQERFGTVQSHVASPKDVIAFRRHADDTRTRIGEAVAPRHKFIPQIIEAPHKPRSATAPMMQKTLQMLRHAKR